MSRGTILDGPRRLLRTMGALMPLVVLLGGCGTRHRLAEYDFRGLTLAVEPHFPPFPEVLTGPYFPGHPRDPIHAIIRAGTLLAKELEAREVRVRLDSAATLVDLPALVGERLGRESARHLGARLIDDVDAADLVLEVEIRDYGIDAEDWDAAARFFVDAEVWLRDADTRRLIWQTRVRARDPIAPAIFGGPSAVRDVVTAAALAGLSVEDVARALRQLAYYSADQVSDRLRSALDDTRR